MENTLSRRSFLKGTGLGAGLFGAGVLGASTLAAPLALADEGGSVDAPAADASAAGSSWREAPAVPENATDAGTYDVVVVGHGYAGVCAARELAEQGKSVALLEVQSEDTYMAQGNQSAATNSNLVAELTSANPAPTADPVEYMNNWMLMTYNQANPGLIMRYAQNMGDAIDWYYDACTDEDKATFNCMSWPADGPFPHMMTELGAFKFYPADISAYGECSQTVVQGYNRQKAIDAGAEFFFETRGTQLAVEDGVVKGVYAKQGDNDLLFNADAVIVATGGFAYNEEMLNDLLPDMVNNMVPTEQWRDAMGNPRFTEGGTASSSPYQGDGIKMAVWAGARLEHNIAGMNARHIEAPAGMSSYPQAVWVRSDGKRFCNEFWPVIEQRGVQNVYMNREKIICVMDDNFDEYRQYVLTQHGFAAPTESTIAAMRQSMDDAYAKFNGTYEGEEESAGGMGGPFAAPELIADDTLEGLAAQLGLEGTAAEEFIAQIERYNSYCESGFDEEFGRDAAVLFPVAQAPFYACKGNPGFGEIMCTCGGVVTDAEQNALDANYNPIPGLYVTGNDCGRRFGPEYITPTTGVSLQIVITLGRECAKSVINYLEDPQALIDKVAASEAVLAELAAEEEASAATSAAVPTAGGPGEGEGAPEGEGASAEGANAAPAAEEEAAATDTPAEEAAGVDCSPCHGDAHKPGDDNPHGY